MKDRKTACSIIFIIVVPGLMSIPFFVSIKALKLILFPITWIVGISTFRSVLSVSRKDAQDEYKERMNAIRGSMIKIINGKTWFCCPKCGQKLHPVAPGAHGVWAVCKGRTENGRCNWSGEIKWQENKKEKLLQQTKQNAIMGSGNHEA